MTTLEKNSKPLLFQEYSYQNLQTIKEFEEQFNAGAVTPETVKKLIVLLNHLEEMIASPELEPIVAPVSIKIRDHLLGIITKALNTRLVG